MEALIASGHSAVDVWSYTPRRIKAFILVANRRRRHEAAETLALQAMAARGEGAEVRRKVKEMTKD